MKKARMIFISLLSLCIIITLAFTNFKKNAISEITNTKLAEIDISGAGLHGIATQFIDYINDRIGFRESSLNVYQVLNDKLFGEMTHPSYCYGKDGYVFFKMEKDEPDEDFIREFVKYLSLVQEYCNSRDVPFIYVITPAKTTIYNEYLPKGYHYNNTYLEYLRKYLKEYNINYVDNAEYLSELSKSEEIFNKEYDAGHWNDLGEFYGTNNILKKLQEYFPEQPLLDMNDYNIVEETMTSLPVSRFPINETVPKFTYKYPERVNDLTELYSGISLDKQHHTFKVTENRSISEENPSVLFFHGSYYNRNLDLYNFIFRNTYAVHNYENFLDFDYYFNIFRPQCVIMESAEYATNSSYFDYDKMSSKVLNTPLSEQNTEKAAVVEIRNGTAVSEGEIIDNISITDVDSEGDLVMFSASVFEKYSYGYYKSGDLILDVKISKNKISITTDKSISDLKDGTMYLFK